MKQRRVFLETCILYEATDTHTHTNDAASSEFRLTCNLKNFNSRFVAKAMRVLGAQMEVQTRKTELPGGEIEPQSAVKLVCFHLSEVREVYVHSCQKHRHICKRMYVPFPALHSTWCGILPGFVFYLLRRYHKFCLTCAKFCRAFASATLWTPDTLAAAQSPPDVCHAKGGVSAKVSWEW